MVALFKYVLVLIGLPPFFAFTASGQPGSADPALTIDFPAERLVFQRDSQGEAVIPIRGRCPEQAKLQVRASRRDVPTEVLPWRDLGVVGDGDKFNAELKLSQGWYSVEIRALAPAGPTWTNRIERLGVGEVFIVAGHSVAQGGDINLPGADDDRVNTIALNPEQQRLYEGTANSERLPAISGSKFSDGVKPAPFGHGTYFWAQFGEALAQKLDVPILILNAGFGGTSLTHWAKSARGESFEHSFVRSEIGMPYANLRNALRKYAAVLGLRAVLSDHGQNDAPATNATAVYENYKTVIAQARADLGFDRLAFMINRQTPYLEKRQIREAQERIITEIPNTFKGPDYDLLNPEDRPDRIHLSESGMKKAAAAWADAVDSEFLERAIPFQPSRKP